MVNCFFSSHPISNMQAISNNASNKERLIKRTYLFSKDSMRIIRMIRINIKKGAKSVYTLRPRNF